MWWSYVLMICGVVGLYLIGNKIKAGWYINIGAQALWIIYAVMTTQWGFIVSAVIYGITYANGLAKFDKVKETQDDVYGE